MSRGRFEMTGLKSFYEGRKPDESEVRVKPQFYESCLNGCAFVFVCGVLVAIAIVLFVGYSVSTGPR